MNLNVSGKNTSIANISNISEMGLWIIINDKEYFIPFALYPELKKATIEALFNITVLSPKQLYWKELDYDIEVDALEKPAEFPLHFRSRCSKK